VATWGFAVFTPIPQVKFGICVCVTVADQYPEPTVIVGVETPVEGRNLSFVVSPYTT
jgi:hypothetical protein